MSQTGDQKLPAPYVPQGDIAELTCLRTVFGTEAFVEKNWDFAGFPFLSSVLRNTIEGPWLFSENCRARSGVWQTIYMGVL
jgi:hypothetical protein